MGIKLSKFLCCFELETGGIVIGVFHFLLAVLGIIACFTEFIELVQKSCYENEDCKFDRKVLIGVSVIIAMTCSAWAFFSFKCIEATKRHKHDLLSSMTNMLIVFTVMAFLLFIFCVACQGSHLTIFGWSTLLFGCVNLYSVIVINSIYKNFKEENNAHRSRVELSHSSMLKDIIEMDRDSAITYQNRRNIRNEI